MPVVFKDSLFDTQWLRTAAYASSGGAEIGECLAAARQIRELDGESWFHAWNDLGERVLAQAEESQVAGRRVSARTAFLRASNYFRAAYTFLVHATPDPRLVATYRRHRTAFAGAATLIHPAAERIAIPYGERTLHGYLFRAADDGTARPTLIITGGYDSTAEEAYFISGTAAVERGYTCLAFDGPGQGDALIEQRMVFRPDWESVVGPVVDYARSRSEVDPERIALLGVSFGGYLAPRAASGEPRLAACIADPGDFSLLDELKSRLPGFVARHVPNGSPVMLALLAALLRRRMRHVTAGWALRRGLWTHGVETPLAYVRLTEQYTLEGRVERIRCPTLVCQAENDAIGVTAPALFDRLKCEKAFMRFASSDGAGEHCETGARSLFNQRAFDWLDDVLRR